MEKKYFKNPDSPIWEINSSNEDYNYKVILDAILLCQKKISITNLKTMNEEDLIGK